jgi:4-amino-4-deoxy-L-arabinose transferase-like glycosyltransferase
MTQAAFWLALAVAGYAASLGLIVAGPSLHYQHYPPLAEVWATHPWRIGFIAFQTLAVSLAILRLARSTWSIGSPLAVRVTIAILLSASTAATVSPQPSRYVAELIFAAFLQILSLATLVLFVLALPRPAVERANAAIDRLLGTNAETGDRDVPGLDRFAWTAAAASTLIAAALNWFAYEHHPHLPDEVVYLHHARYFAEGLLTMPAPPIPAAFEMDLLEYEPTRWFSPVPVGWPAVLALGAVVGAAWLVNPLLTGANVLLAYMMLGHLYLRRVTRASTLLLALSPWSLFLGMSYMTHTLTLTCALVAGLGVAKAKRAASPVWSTVGGLGVGATSLIRPLDGVIIGALVALWALGVGGARLRFTQLAGLLAGTVLAAALVLPYNRAVSGEPLKFPINAYIDKHYAPNANAYGFGADRGMGWAIDPYPGHGPVDAVINTNLNVFGLNTDLFGWSTGSLIFVTWLLCSGSLRRDDVLMLATIVAFAGAYFFYYFSGGPDFGARYWYPIVVPLVALTARGIQSIEQRLGARVWIVTGALLLMTVTLYLPWRASDKYFQFRGMRPDIRALAAQHGFADDLVLVRGRRFPDYASAFAENPVDLTSKVPIYAWDRDAEVRAAVVRVYGDRRVWIVDGPTVTGDGYRVVDGPLPASAVLSAETAK